MTTKQNETSTKHYAKVREHSAVDLRVTDLIRLDSDNSIVMVERVDRSDRYVPGDYASDIIYVYYWFMDGDTRVRGSIGIGRYATIKRYALIEVGMPATIHLMNDSIAAVVTKINKKSIAVRRVATDEAMRHRINDEREPLPFVAEPGILDQPVGDPERYAVMPNGRIGSGSIHVTIGKSITSRDYRV